MTALRLQDVGVSLDGRPVVEGVTAGLEHGEWAVVIGPNGAGKTTLLRAVAGLVPCTGRIEIGGQDASTMRRRERAQRLAVVSQLPSTPPWLTVADYVLLGRTPHLRPLSSESRSDFEAVERALVQLDLTRLASRQLGTLSGGERQRVVIARALAQEARLVLLDEPTSALDLGYQQQALELLDGLRAEVGLTLLAAMHDLTLAAQYADRLLLLDGGRLLADGPPQEVLTEEQVSATYRASVQVLPVGGSVAVLPRRTGSS